jgi:membrane protease YdiL (CAAX protease family)
MTTNNKHCGLSPQEKKAVFEVFLLFGGAFLFLLASNLLSHVGGFIGENAGSLGVGYLVLAPFLLTFKGKSWDKDALSLIGDARKALISCLTVIVLVFPVYALLYHGWFRLWEGAKNAVPSFLLADFDEELRGRPEKAKGVTLWLEGQRIFIVNLSDKPTEVNLDGCSDKAFLVTSNEHGEVIPLGKLESERTITMQIKVHQGISCDLSRSQEFSARTDHSGGGFFVGPSSHARGEEVANARSLGWIFDLLLLQVLGVAFPEEFFFRGYCQTRLRLFFKKRYVVFGVNIGGEIVVASLLFALVHLAGGFSILRLAVFFPGLLFGLLREYSGGIVAPTIVHALSNCILRLLQRWHGI